MTASARRIFRAAISTLSLLLLRSKELLVPQIGDKRCQRDDYDNTGTTLFLVPGGERLRTGCLLGLRGECRYRVEAAMSTEKGTPTS